MATKHPSLIAKPNLALGLIKCSRSPMPKRCSNTGALPLKTSLRGMQRKSRKLTFSLPITLFHTSGMPAAAKCLDQGDRCRLPVGLRLHQRTTCIECAYLGNHYV